MSQKSNPKPPVTQEAATRIQSTEVKSGSQTRFVGRFQTAINSNEKK